MSGHLSGCRCPVCCEMSYENDDPALDRCGRPQPPEGFSNDITEKGPTFDTPVRTVTELGSANVANIFEVNSFGGVNGEWIRIDCNGKVTLNDDISVKSLVRDFTSDELRVLCACVSKAIELKEKEL